MNIGVQLNRIHTEDLVWIIYIFIIIGALASNYYEENFLKTKDKEFAKTFHIINIIILTVGFFIYLYFVSLRLDDIKYLNPKNTKKEVITSHIAFLASFFFLVGGFLALFLELKSAKEAEVGFI